MHKSASMRQRCDIGATVARNRVGAISIDDLIDPFVYGVNAKTVPCPFVPPPVVVPYSVPFTSISPAAG
jgi:hypothetical protein